MLNKKIARFLSLLLLLSCAVSHALGSELHLVSTQAIAGDTKWDNLSFEAGSHRLFITHGDRVDVYDTLERKVIGAIPNTLGVHGVALAPELDRGYTSNGLSSTVTVSR